jgi:asparagine synthetase B (glutamine-hydrolysing)
LVTDKVGVRPLYLWFDDELVVFASTLRVLGRVLAGAKQMDVQAVTEMVAFGTPLSDRTPFAGVRLVKGGEIIEIGRKTVRREVTGNGIRSSPQTILKRNVCKSFTIAFKPQLSVALRMMPRLPPTSAVVSIRVVWLPPGAPPGEGAQL